MNFVYMIYFFILTVLLTEIITKEVCMYVARAI